MNKPNTSIMKKIFIAVTAGIVFGIVFLLLKTYLINNGYGESWQLINSILFQDITTTEGLNSTGVFFIVGKLFMNALQLAIVPLVLISLSLAMCSLSNPEKLGKIAGKTVLYFILFYIVAAAFTCCIAYLVKSLGWFDVNLSGTVSDNTPTMPEYNPLTIIIELLPNNIISAFSSNNQILSVVVIAVILGICMHALPEKTKSLKALFNSGNAIIQLYLEFLINKIGPFAIFCMISRTFAIYGLEYLKPTSAFILTGIATGIFLVLTLYPLAVFFITKLNPLIFIKKTLKIGLFAAATNSSAATLPLNMRTCINELGCSKEITSFILPTGMTINMNGTTVMHILAVTFIATSAGIDVTPVHLILASLISITVAMGCPAIPVAGTTMVLSVLAGLGFTSDACLIGYAIVVAMNYPIGMAVITMNVVGDAATNVIICAQENELNEQIYNSKSEYKSELS